MDTANALLERWADEARELRSRYALESAARICEAHVRELTEALRERQDKLLTVAEAAHETGYSNQHLRALLASGALPNAGRKGRPRIRRADLPARKGRARRRPSDPGAKPVRRRDARVFDARRVVRGG